MLTKRSTAQTAWTMPAKRRTTSLPRVPDEPVVGHDNQAALTQAERRKAVDLIQKLLDMVDEGARPSVTPHTPCSGLCVQHPASSTAAPGLVESGGPFGPIGTALSCARMSLICEARVATRAH